MIYLESIGSFGGKTVQDFINKINRDYNFKEIKDKIIQCLNKYDIEYNPYDIEIILTIDNELITFKDRLLYVSYCLNKINFDNINLDNIYNSQTSVMRTSSGNRIMEMDDAYKCFTSTAKSATMEISLDFRKDGDPSDIIQESLLFLENKYGFENNGIHAYKIYKMMTYKKVISL